MPNQSAFEIFEVSFAYRWGVDVVKPVIEDFSMEIEAGSTMAILGETGLGKSTLLRLLAGLEQPQRGSVTYFGRRIREPTRDVAMVPQRPSLFPWLTVESNLRFFARFGTKSSSARAWNVLKFAGLQGSGKKLPRELSVGMQQIVRLACGIAQGARVLLLDEPLASVDVLTREALGLVIRESVASAEVTTLLVTHSPGEAVLCCNEVAVVYGRPIRAADRLKANGSNPVNEQCVRELLKERQCATCD